MPNYIEVAALLGATGILLLGIAAVGNCVIALVGAIHMPISEYD